MAFTIEDWSALTGEKLGEVRFDDDGTPTLTDERMESTLEQRGPKGIDWRDDPEGWARDAHPWVSGYGYTRVVGLDDVSGNPKPGLTLEELVR